MSAKDRQTPAGAMEELKQAIADTAPWRMLVRFVDRHPRLSLLGLPLLLTAVAAYYLSTDRYLDAAVVGGLLLCLSWHMRR